MSRNDSWNNGALGAGYHEEVELRKTRMSLTNSDFQLLLNKGAGTPILVAKAM